MLLGEVLTRSLTWYGASPDSALSCTAAAWDLGLKFIGDCYEPYKLFVRGQPSPLWTALSSVLEKAGVSPAIKDKVLRHVGNAAKAADSVSAATAAKPAAATAAKPVAAGIHAPVLAPATTRPAPSAKRRRPRGQREHVLPEELCDLAVVSTRLTKTVELYDRCAKLEKAKAPGYSSSYNWKKRKIPDGYKYWNMLDSPALRQLQACAIILLEANGSFVAQVDLFRAARQIDPTLAHVQKASQHDYSPRFRPWLMHYLYPAVQEFVHERGVAGHKQTRISFYMCPNGAASARNVKASFQGLLVAADERDVCNRLRAVPVQQYMELLPDHASQRVLRSLLLEVSGSTSFLNGAFGFNVGSLHRARQRVDLALLHSAQCEMQAQSVRSDLTVAGQHTLYLQSVREARAMYLEDKHSGGVVSKVEQCEAAGLNLKAIIEEAADELGEFSFEEVCARAEEGGTAVGSARISDARGSHGEEAAERSQNCTWENLTSIVVTKVQLTLADFRMDERTLRCYCVAQRSSTAEAARHVDASQAARVKAQKPKSSREEWNIDMHESSAEVAYFEELHARLLATGASALYLPWDDHSKIEPGKKRGFASRKCVMHTRRAATAPYSDMGVKLGGAKVVINSMLFTLPPGADPEHAATVSVSKRGGGTPVFKQAVGVVRLESERRSTPIQQFNDLRYATERIPMLSTFMGKVTHAFFISDNGWDHSVRNHEVQWAHTLHHLECDRDYDAACTRAKGGSSYQEAERAVETGAIAKGGTPEVDSLPVPTSVAQLTENKRSFQLAITNAIAGAKYACTPLIALASYPGCPGASDHMSGEQRAAIRKLMDMAPSKLKAGLPYVELYMNVEFYRTQHTLPRHYSIQWARHECAHASRLGRPCKPSDYPFPAALTFKTCSERPLRSAAGALELIAQPPLDAARKGHRLPPEKASAAVAAGTLDPRKASPPTSKQLKAWGKEHDSLNPSATHAEHLATRLLGDVTCIDQIDKFFSIKRLERFMKAEEQRAALADPKSTAYLQLVVLRIMSRAAESIEGIASPFKAAEYRLLLSDERVNLSPRGTAKEMMERIFDNKDHIINIFTLDRTAILNAPTDAGELVDDEEDDPLICSVCASGDATEANPIVKCDGEHETEVGVHLGCMDPPMDTVPDDEWFCAKCQEKSIYQVEAIVDKHKAMKRLRNGHRTGKPCVHYKVKWVGAQWEGHDTWEPLENLQSERVKAMVSEYNKAKRVAR